MKTKKAKRGVYWYPKTNIGKWSFWLTLLGLVTMYLQYWIAMATNGSSPIWLGLSSIALLVIFGISSIVSIAKFNDRAILLFFTSLFGLFGIFMILGEFIFPH
jgi:hypothetical protein